MTLRAVDTMIGYHAEQIASLEKQLTRLRWERQWSNLEKPSGNRRAPSVIEREIAPLVRKLQRVLTEYNDLRYSRESHDQQQREGSYASRLDAMLDLAA